MLFLPPRHGKTELATIRYPIYRLADDPQMRVIIGAYNQTLANKFSRKARKLARAVGVPLSADRKAVEEWETTDGGGFRAAGVGGGITGMGGDLIIIDDPVKSREEAESKTYRDRVYDWYTDDLYTRLEPGGAIILIMTRWHDDDLAGRILASSDAASWRVVKLPAEAETDDPLNRAVGEALNPARYPVTALAKIRTVLGMSYYALYQQTPRARDGEFFKRSYFPIVDSGPAFATRVRWWDRAATDGAGNYTAGVLVAITRDGTVFIEDVERGQWSSAKRDEVIRQTAVRDVAQHGQVHTWGPQDPGSAGKDVALAFVRLLSGFAAFTDIESGSKELRAEPFQSQCIAGNVRLVKGAWNATFIDELCAFPTGAYDDQVDAVSNAYNKAALRAGQTLQVAANPYSDYRG